MSRLEKARAQKKRGKKITAVILGLLVAVLLVGGGVFLLLTRDAVTVVTEDSDLDEAGLIDLDRSTAFIDMFELTYVRVYTEEGRDVSSISAGGEELTYNLEGDRWELTTSGPIAGDSIKVAAVGNGSGRVEEEVELVVEELGGS